MSSYPLLDSVAAPQQVHHFSLLQMEQLAREVRQFLIDSVSVTGGHVVSAPNAPQLTVAADDGATTVDVVVAPAPTSTVVSR